MSKFKGGKGVYSQAQLDKLQILGQQNEQKDEIIKEYEVPVKDTVKLIQLLDKQNYDQEHRMENMYNTWVFIKSLFSDIDLTQENSYKISSKGPLRYFVYQVKVG
jgi:hypothetical protein